MLACALAVPAVQAILTAIHLSWLAVLVSPLHALCLLCILVIQWMWRHPAQEALMPLWQERAAALARNRQSISDVEISEIPAALLTPAARTGEG